MKPLLIGWVSRAGKSMLSTLLAKKYRLNRIPLDPLITSFEEIYPDIGIGHKGEHAQLCKHFSPFLTKFLEELLYEWSNFVVESYHFLPSLLSDEIREKYTIIIIWYPSIGLEEKFVDIRQYDSDDRTQDIDDATLKECILSFIKQSKLYRDECLEYNIPFIDVSKNLPQKIREFCLEIDNISTY